MVVNSDEISPLQAFPMWGLKVNEIARVCVCVGFSMGQSLRLMARSTDRDLLPRSLSLSFNAFICMSASLV